MTHMHFTPDTRSNHLTLDETLARLAASEHVAGLALFGSRAAGGATEASDYDLLILVHSLPVGIFQMLSHIDCRLADVVFVTTATADRLLASAEPVPDRTNDGRFLLKMATAKIVHDSTGRLARAQAHARRHPPTTQADFPAAYGAWFWHNFALIQVQRMARSADPEVLTAVDLMISAGLGEICRAYCLLRGLPWQGEKAALRHLQAADPAYLALLRDCLAASDRSQKVHRYAQLVAATLAPVGAPWQPGLTAVALDGPTFTPIDVATALDYWESLFSITPDPIDPDPKGL